MSSSSPELEAALGVVPMEQPRRVKERFGEEGEVEKLGRCLIRGV